MTSDVNQSVKGEISWSGVKSRAIESLPCMAFVFALIVAIGGIHSEALSNVDWETIKTSIIVASITTPAIWVCYSLLGIKRLPSPQECLKKDNWFTDASSAEELP